MHAAQTLPHGAMPGEPESGTVLSSYTAKYVKGRMPTNSINDENEIQFLTSII